MDTLGQHLSRAIVIELAVKDIYTLDIQSQAEIKKGSFELLEILHHVSAGFKALITDLVYEGMD